MKSSRSLNLKIAFAIITLSVLSWIVLILFPNLFMIEDEEIVICGAVASNSITQFGWIDYYNYLFGWGLMVLAMMAPKLILPIQFICARSFKHLRFLCSSTFVLGYMTMWLLVAVLIQGFVEIVGLLIVSEVIRMIVVALALVIWQCTPIKQYFLNQGHNHLSISAFGWKALKDAFVFGLKHGVWCIGAGWLLMTFPLFIKQGHYLAMFLVTIVMISEHLEYPKPVRWRIDLRMKLIKILYFQSRMRLKLVFDR